MARIDLLVDGKKHRFILSTAASDSLFPEHLVPPGRLVQKAIPFLADVVDNTVNTCGFYQAVLESSDADFCLSFALTVTKGSFAVLGNDFLEKARIKSMCFGSAAHLVVENHKGTLVRLPLTVQVGPDENGCVIVPGVHRLPIQAPSSPHAPSKPTSSSSNGGHRNQRTSVAARNVVFFHLETTGFGNDAEIIQIAASCRSKTFNAYILPDGDIHSKATERNGFLKTGDRLYLRGRAVTVSPRRQAVDNFLAFLRGVGGDAVLAAHNAFPFHAPILKRLFESLGLARQFESQVRGLADTLPLFRKALQGQAHAGKSFSLEDLSKDLLGEQVPLLYAEETVATLERLLKKVRISYKEVIKSAEPVVEM